jgi:hypothetical protein
MLPGTMRMIHYENNASQQKLFVHELEPSFLIKKTALFSGTRPFSTLLTG